MKIEIITTPNDDHKETGFGTLKACKSVLKSVQKLGHDVQLNVCKTRSSLDDIVKAKPDLVVLAVKYISINDEDDIWSSDYCEKNEVNRDGEIALSSNVYGERYGFAAESIDVTVGVELPLKNQVARMLASRNDPV